MQRSTSILCFLSVLCFAIAPAHAARSRQLQVLDTDSLLAEEQIDFVLQLARRPDGEAVVIDSSTSTPRRLTPLGLALPAGPASASYTAIPDLDANSNVVAAVATGDAIHVFELGDLTASVSPLDALPRGSVATEPGLDPASVAVSQEHVWGDPHETVLSETLVISYSTSEQSRARALVGDAWVAVAPLSQYGPDLAGSSAWTFEEGWPFVEDVDSLDAGSAQFTLATLLSIDGELLLLDESPSTAPRMTPLGYTAPSGTTKGEFLETPGGDVWAAFGSSDGIRVLDLGDLTAPGPLAPVDLAFFHASGGWDPTTVRTGIIAILIGLAVEPRPALYIGETEKQIVLGWNGTAFAPVRFIEEEGIFYFF